MRTVVPMALIVLLGCSPNAPSAEPPTGVRLGPARFAMGTDTTELPSIMARYGISHAELFAGEMPRRTVSLDPFEIDRTEVTNAAFAAFVADQPEWAPESLGVPGYLETWVSGVPPSGEEQRPVAFVTWRAAVAFCAAAGGRLPTEAEWEYAARGGLSGEVFPWGDRMPDAEDANWSGTGLDRTVDVASYPPNGYGLYDMAGNVWEWTSDAWVGADADAPRRVIRGGSFGAAPVNLRVRYRDSHRESDPVAHVGFRCARSVR